VAWCHVSGDGRMMEFCLTDMLEKINILCSTNMHSGKIKDKDLGLLLAIFAQAFQQRFEEQKNII